MIVALTLFYTFEGGMTAVIWTDVVQMTLYAAGAVVSLFTILNKMPHGWAQVYSVGFRGGTNSGSLISSFAPTLAWLSQPYTFWAGVLGGCFLCTASHGTEQLMVAAPAGRAQPEREPQGAVRQLGRGGCAVLAVPADWHDPVVALPRESLAGSRES